MQPRLDWSLRAAEEKNLTRRTQAPEHLAGSKGNLNCALTDGFYCS